MSVMVYTTPVEFAKLFFMPITKPCCPVTVVMLIPLKITVTTVTKRVSVIVNLCVSSSADRNTVVAAISGTRFSYVFETMRS